METDIAQLVGMGGLVISVLLGYWHVIHQNCQLIAGDLYQKENFKNIFSIWSERQLGGKPLSSHRGLTAFFHPLNGQFDPLCTGLTIFKTPIL